MRTDCSSRLRRFRKFLVEQQRAALKEILAAFQEQRFLRQHPRGVHVARALLELSARLRRLVARQIPQQHLLRSVFERDSKLVLALLVLLRADLRLQSLERAEGVVRDRMAGCRPASMADVNRSTSSAP